MDEITLAELIARLEDIADTIDHRTDGGPTSDDVIVRITTGAGWPMQHRLGEAALSTDHEGNATLYLEVGDHPDNPYTPDLDDAERF